MYAGKIIIIIVPICTDSYLLVYLCKLKITGNRRIHQKHCGGI